MCGYQLARTDNDGASAFEPVALCQVTVSMTRFADLYEQSWYAVVASAAVSSMRVEYYIFYCS